MPNTLPAFRILSLDGGGVRGYLSAKILANVESYLNTSTGSILPIGMRFDLIAGTSTGGIIALGLAHGLHAATIAAFYEEHAANIFPRNERRNWFTRKLKPRYNSAPLRNTLALIFPNGTTLAHLKRDVCITAVALSNAKPRLYKTDYLKRNAGRLDESLVDIALATTAAPTYFAAHTTKHSSNLIDGGICTNNPSMVAVVDALQFERPSKRETSPPKGLTDIVMLSIGTGDPCAMTYDYAKLARAGELAWARSYFEVSIESQSQLVHFQSQFLLPNYFRVNPQLRFAMPLDDHERMLELRNLADLNAEIEAFALMHLSS